jgi:hypothetical protein
LFRWTDGDLPMRELEASLQQFGKFLLKAKFVKERAAPYCVRWVRRFLTRPASDEPLADQVRRFCEGLDRESIWQVHQARCASNSLISSSARTGIAGRSARS